MSEKLYKPILIDSIKASENVEKLRFINFDGKYCSAGELAYGVSDVEIEQGQFIPVALTGILLVVAGGGITAKSAVTSDANGKAVIASTGDAKNGYALDSGAAGQIIRIVRGI